MRARAGCVGAVVERVEVVVDRLDLGALQHREAEPEEDVFQFAARAASARAVARPAAAGAPGSVTSTASSRRLRSQLGAAQLGARASISPSSAWRARWRPCRPPPAARAASSATPRSSLRQLGLAPEIAHAQLLAAPRCAAAAAISVARLQRCNCSIRSIMTPGTLVEPPRSVSYSATVAAIAAFSDSAAIGMWATCSHALTTSAGRPVALGADEQRHDLSGGEPGGHGLQRLARAGDERDALSRQLARVTHARERDGEDRAHARPHGLGRVGIRAVRPERHAGGAEGNRAAQHSADVAGVARRRADTRTAGPPARRTSAARRRRSRACPSRAPRRPRAPRARRR